MVMLKFDVESVDVWLNASEGASDETKETLNRLGPRFNVPSSALSTEFAVNGLPVIPARSVRNGRWVFFPEAEIDPELLKGLVYNAETLQLTHETPLSKS